MTDRSAPPLTLIYAGRSAAAIVWVAALLTLTQAGSLAADPPQATVVALVALYPIIDAVATLIDLRTTTRSPVTAAHYAEIAGDLLCTAAILTAGRDGYTALLATFGAWGIIAGAVQLGVALQRARAMRGQWLMAISGAGSVLAGLGYLAWTGTPQNALDTLAQYSLGGIVWYLIAAAFLTRYRHRPRSGQFARR
ncbi:MAG TPA: hypothetical protein VGP36_19125 [Mycobacteriales bacterium]|jgi:uncharacterized membrane protein HdeD (DUF308 family)|nr:hypothetical protein [Mycobacteriales bacterium]